MSSYRKIRKKVLKYLASSMPINQLRIKLYRAAMYSIGEDVYIGEKLTIVDKLSDQKNITIGGSSCNFTWSYSCSFFRTKFFKN